MSSVIRVVKNCNYTTLSNYHFRDRRLSWKAKGLLSTMLSLPDDWNYTIEGLASLSDDGIKSTNSGLAELEKCGYLVRKQLRDANGHFIAMEYTIYEQAVIEEKSDQEQEITEPIGGRKIKEEPLCQNGQTVENTEFSPLCPKRQTEKRFAEKGMLLNTNILNTKESSTYCSSSSSSSQKEPVPIPMAGTECRSKNDEEDEGQEEKLRERLKIKSLASKYSPILIEAVFGELIKRDKEFQELMTDKVLEQVCRALLDKQNREPIRMLPNLINTYLDNIMLGIKAAGNSGGNSPPLYPVRSREKNSFNQFQQNQYDFEALEKELMSN